MRILERIFDRFKAKICRRTLRTSRIFNAEDGGNPPKKRVWTLMWTRPSFSMAPLFSSGSSKNRILPKAITLLRQHRTKIARELRSQFFRQSVQIECSQSSDWQAKAVRYDGKSASKSRAKAVGRSLCGVALMWKNCGLGCRACTDLEPMDYFGIGS